MYVASILPLDDRMHQTNDMSLLKLMKYLLHVFLTLDKRILHVLDHGIKYCNPFLPCHVPQHCHYSVSLGFVGGYL